MEKYSMPTRIYSGTDSLKELETLNNERILLVCDSFLPGSDTLKEIESHINNSNNFDFSNLDINTILKMKSVMEKLNNKNDPRYNLLNSLKPYLRDEKKNKIDQYANLLNIAKIAEIFNSDNKENNNDI